MTKKDIRILGIETSCDETAAAIIASDSQSETQGKILSDIVLSQMEAHAPYGGVVPEIAARAHVDHLDQVIAQAMQEANLEFSDLDAIAATAGPGLVGGVIVGLMTAKGIAKVHDLPLIGVNHLEGHALSVRLMEDISFPYLLLLISGGHCQLLAVEGPGHYARYGTTLDDAAGEAFDKTAKLMGLPYPGGPSIEQAAKTGDVGKYDFPRPLKGREGADFSFSGLKTAVLQKAREFGVEKLPQEAIADIAASFQQAVCDVLADRCANAMARFCRDTKTSQPTLVVAGGVAANQAVRSRLTALCEQHSFSFIAPPTRLCTDNGAMIAWAGIERFRLGLTDPLSIAPLARWPLEDL